MKQRTLQNMIQATGVGLHTGKKILMGLFPAPPNHGIRFRRMDLDPPVTIPVDPNRVGDTFMSTTLGSGDERVDTIEHLLSACAGLGVDNLLVELSGPEVPIMDGSAAAFVFLLQSAGISEQPVAKRFLRIRKPVSCQRGDAWAKLLPGAGFRVEFTIDFEHPAVRATRQTLSVDFATTSYIREIARARTFGFMRDSESLREKGLAQGGS